MERTRVAVTGLGTISSNGTDLASFWHWICHAPAAPVVTPVSDFDPRRWLSAKDVRRSDVFSQYGVAASHEAVRDAGIDPAEVAPRRGGVVLANVYGAQVSLEAERDRMEAGAEIDVAPYLSAASCESTASAMVSIHLGWRGPSRVISTACAGGTHAVSEAADLIRSGRCDVVVAGGTMGPITPVLMASYRNLRVLSPTGWLRPFDRRRDGFVFADGAAALVLEPLDAARSRGARIYAEVLGSGQTNDAESLVNPSQLGAVECIEDALADAELHPSDIAHVNAHGTGTVVNDTREAEALHHVFGTPPPVTSTKRVMGHAAAASGAFEAVITALSVHHGVIPSLGPDVDPDPTCGLDLVVGPSRPFTPGPVLSNSFGLGGHNGCLILGPPDA